MFWSVALLQEILEEPISKEKKGNAFMFCIKSSLKKKKIGRHQLDVVKRSNTTLPEVIAEILL